MFLLQVKGDYEEETNSAASFLIREWVEKLLGVKFNSLRDLAVYLIEKMYVDNRSNAAYTVISAMKKSGEGKDQFQFLCNIWNIENFSCIKLIVMCNFSIFIFISVQDSKSQILNGGNQAVEMQEHKRKIEVIHIIN